jgi:hypothetical protein
VSAIITGVNLKTEHFPVWAEPLAITLTVMCVVSIPGYAVKKLCSLEGPITQVNIYPFTAQGSVILSLFSIAIEILN